MDLARTGPDEKRIYQATYERAKRYALRHVPADQASEVAHDVAVSILRWTLTQQATGQSERSMSAFIYRSVVNRLRDGHRSRNARVAAEDSHASDVRDAAPGWANPHSALEAKELSAVIRRVLVDMPPAMRTIFLLIREHDRSYKEVAAELSIAVGTVHTQLSRANALLRSAIDRHKAAEHETPPASANTSLRTSA